VGYPAPSGSAAPSAVPGGPGSRYPGDMPHSLLVVHVHVHVKPELVDAFREATLENARESVKEPGVARFDVVQDTEDRTRFVLVEAYRTPEAPAAHKETAHYQRWRDTVAPMMAEPRTSRKYVNCFPEDSGW
jgi:(4S)-4-hydroxy-5-phosphonooxypentane-2,3-dione isomerase